MWQLFGLYQAWGLLKMWDSMQGLDGGVCLAARSTLDARGLPGKTHRWGAVLSPLMATVWQMGD